MSKTNWVGMNINDKVRVRPAAHGGAILRENYENLWRDTPRAAPVFTLPNEDKDGYSEWQLWDLIKQFGQHLWNGCRIPFVDNEVQFQVNKAPEWFPPDTAPKDGQKIFAIIQHLNDPPEAACIRWSEVNGWEEGFRGEPLNFQSLGVSSVKLVAWKPAAFTESDLQ